MTERQFNSYVDLEIQLWYKYSHFPEGDVASARLLDNVMYPTHHIEEFLEWRSIHSFTTHLHRFYHGSYNSIDLGLNNDFNYRRFLDVRNIAYSMSPNLALPNPLYDVSRFQQEPRSPSPVEQNPDTRNGVYIEPARCVSAQNLGKSDSSLLGDGFPLQHLTWDFTPIFVVKDALTKNYMSDDNTSDSENDTGNIPNDAQIIEIISSSDDDLDNDDVEHPSLLSLFHSYRSSDSSDDERKRPAV